MRSPIRRICSGGNEKILGRADRFLRHERFLLKEKFLDEKKQKEIEATISALLEKDRDFAGEFTDAAGRIAEPGVYCTGDDCHKIRAKWERPVAEVTPPKVQRTCRFGRWKAFGSGKGSGGGSAPIHFAIRKHEQKEEPAASNNAQEARRKNIREEAVAVRRQSANGSSDFLDAISKRCRRNGARPDGGVDRRRCRRVMGRIQNERGLLAKFGWERVIDRRSARARSSARRADELSRPAAIAEMQFIDFIVCAFNQITNFVAKGHYLWNAPAPIVIRGPAGGGVHGGHSLGESGMYFVHTPGLKVIYPRRRTKQKAS